ncbi:DUF1289 domain-containing protein [Vibrio sp. T187]|uniref:DUF1289 domain-containing protein n=1 Tax=Vibrio TaxID=662 RepID=UPI0010C9D4AE|nr:MULTISPECIES: DUF1289 domain-containing protein [Vibrio]MBW3696836.1 DUF1289 domain-containing protein [Vibrio sp. T187]
MDSRDTEFSDIGSKSVPNPCIRNCCLDDNDVCLGCFRTYDEILVWNASTIVEKEKILQRCAARRVSDDR